MQQSGRGVRTRLVDLVIVLIHVVPSSRNTLHDWPVAAVFVRLLLEVVHEEVH